MLWVTEWAPEPRDVDWKNLKIGQKELFIRQILAVVTAILIALFTAPVIGLVQLLDNVERLTKYLPDYIVNLLFQM